MNQAIVAVILNSVSLVLFVQSTWIGLVLIIRRQALEPPLAPSADEPQNEPHLCRQNYNETQLTISRAVHPHLHPTPSRPPTSTSKPRLTTSCSSNSTLFCKMKTTGLYKLTVPYLSTYLLTVQAALGLSLTLTLAIWNSNGYGNCKLPGQLAIFSFYIGFSLLFLASAVQTHLVNDRCIKIFFIVGAGIATHFAMLAMVLSNDTAKYSLEFDKICLVDIDQPMFGWLGNLPTYSAIAYFFMSFFSFVSFINGSFRLCSRSRFLSPRELAFVMAAYRGVGLLFVFGLLGALFNALGVALSALNMFHFVPFWLTQWAVLSRVLAAALWHRMHSDTMAHMHPFWSSDVYLAWHPVAEQNGCASIPSGLHVISAVFHILRCGNSGLLYTAACEEALVDTMARAKAGNNACMQARARARARARTVAIGRDCVDNEIGSSDMHDRSSRHETVVADIVHCGSCTCNDFIE